MSILLAAYLPLALSVPPQLCFYEHALSEYSLACSWGAMVGFADSTEKERDYDVTSDKVCLAGIHNCAELKKKSSVQNINVNVDNPDCWYASQSSPVSSLTGSLRSFSCVFLGRDSPLILG